MKYAHYDPQTGKLLGWYDEQIHGSNIPQPVLEVSDDIWQEAIVNNYNFVDVENKRLSYKDFRSLDELKQAKKRQAEAEYSRRSQQPVEYTINGTTYTFQADDRAQDIIAKVIATAPDGFTTDWLDIDNKSISVTLADLKGLAGAILTRNEALFQKKVAIKRMIDQAGSKEDLNAIDPAEDSLWT